MKLTRAEAILNILSITCDRLDEIDIDTDEGLDKFLVEGLKAVEAVDQIKGINNND